MYSERTGRASNYSYGRGKEAKVGRELKSLFGCSSYRRSKGSRGPADVTLYKYGIPVISVQVKSARAASTSKNTCSPKERQKLISHSSKMGTIPFIAQCKGRETTYTDLSTGISF